MSREVGEFTDRERDILRLVGRDKRTAPQVAERLDLSVRTVHSYVQDLAKNLPGEAKPRYRIMLYVDGLDDETVDRL